MLVSINFVLIFQDLQVIDFSTDSYMKILEKAMEMGTPVLLQNVTEHIESAIKPVLDKNTVIICKILFLLCYSYIYLCSSIF
jgi:hypothetical protein